MPAAATPSPSRVSRQTAWAFLGRVGYEEALELQESLRRALLGGGEEALLLLEHPPVVTLGRNAPPGDLLASPAWLEANGVELFHIKRGGRATYHGPGQLVGYPIVDLSPDRRDVRRYVRDLQEVLVATLRDYGLEASGGTTSETIGVWVEERKIASIGVHLSRWTTTHGFALNIATDLAMFRGISPCGFSSSTMTSLEQLTGASPPLAEVAACCARHFSAQFERRLVPFDHEQWNRAHGRP